MMSEEPKWKRIVAWIGLVWGSLILLGIFFTPKDPYASYSQEAGQHFGVLIGFLMLCVSIYYLFLRKI